MAQVADESFLEATISTSSEELLLHEVSTSHIYLRRTIWIGLASFKHTIQQLHVVTEEVAEDIVERSSRYAQIIQDTSINGGSCTREVHTKHTTTEELTASLRLTERIYQDASCIILGSITAQSKLHSLV